MGDEGLKFDLGGAASPAPVPLAHTAAFALGPLEVEPALRRVSRDAQNAEQIEPLVMQVLIALASARGATLSRDDLIAACWDGRIVSDDAINRVISRLRRVLERLGAGAVRLETVAKVGYRLTVAELGVDEVAEKDRPSRRPARSRFALSGRALAIGVAGLAVAAGVMAVGAADSRPEAVTIGVETTADSPRDSEATRFASDLTGDFARLANANSRVEVVDRTWAGASPDSDFLMRISVDREAGRLAATARLVAAEDGAVLWSRAYVGEADSAARLREQVALSTAGLVRCGLERSTKSGDAALLRLFFAACDALEDRDWSRAETFARKAVELRPDSAPGWACLAMTTLLAGGEGEKASATDDHRRRAVIYARKALALDPQVGRAYMVLADAGQARPQALAMLEAGIRADPEMPGLHRVYSMNLHNLGYLEAGVEASLRALALDPTALSGYELAGRRLITAGRIDEAFAIQARAERIWPDSPSLLHHRLRFLPYLSDPRDALAQFERLRRAGETNAIPVVLTEDILRWRVDPGSLDLAALDRKAEAIFRKDPVAAWYLAWAMEVLGKRERAFAWLARAPKRNASMQWSLLFSADVAGLRRDPRFFAAMNEVGLVESWRARGKWPDFCSEPGLTYDCRAEAARLGKATRT